MTNKNSNYAAWLIEEKNYPKDGSVAEQINFILHYGVLAPSTHNTQPWRIRPLAEGVFEFAPDWSKELPNSDDSRRGLLLSLGAFLCNVLVAAGYFGWAADYSIDGSKINKIVVRVVFKKDDVSKSKNDFAALFSGILSRRSYKVGFIDKPVDGSIIAAINNMAVSKSKIIVCTGDKQKKDLAGLHYDSTLEFARNRKFSREVSQWMRANTTKQHDGMPGFTFGLSNMQSFFAKHITSLVPATVAVVARKDRTILERASAVGAVYVNNEDPVSLVEAGIAYETASLIAATYNVYFAPKAAAIEAERGLEVARILGIEGSPQLYFGVGYGDDVVRHSPRRPLGSFFDTRERTV